MANDTLSFDIVSKVDLQEVKNAVNQTKKEILQRFDLKGTKTDIDFDGTDIVTLSAPDEMRVKSILVIFQERLIKRSISIKSLDIGEIKDSLAGIFKAEIKVKQGIDAEMAKKIVKLIKDTKLKIQAQIQGDQVRVSGKKKDELQTIIQTIKTAEFNADLQFINYR